MYRPWGRSGGQVPTAREPSQVLWAAGSALGFYSRELICLRAFEQRLTLSDEDSRTLVGCETRMKRIKLMQAWVGGTGFEEVREVTLHVFGR